MKTNDILRKGVLIAVILTVFLSIVAVSNVANAQSFTVPTCSIYATTSTGSGAPVTLSWNSTNATSAFLSPGGGAAVNGSKLVYPTVTTSYTLAVHSAQGYIGHCQTTVYVGSASGTTPSCSIYANTDNISTGQPVTLTWNSSNATSGNLTNIGPVSTNDSRTVNPNVTTTYVLNVYNAQGQSASCQKIITVTGSGYYGSAPSCWITLTPQYGYSGSSYYNQPSTLSWGSTNASSANISPSIGTISTSGSQTVYPSGNQIYTMTAYNSQGQNTTCQTSQYYQPGVSSCTLSANPLSIRNGEASYLTWTSQGNVTSAWLSDGLGNVAPNGSLSVRPESSRNYTLTVIGANGTQSCNAYVTVSGSYYPSLSLTQIPYTGFDMEPIGNVFYFAALALFAFAAGYLVIFYLPNISSLRMFTKLTSRTQSNATTVFAQDVKIPTIFHSDSNAE